MSVRFYSLRAWWCRKYGHRFSFYESCDRCGIYLPRTPTPMFTLPRKVLTLDEWRARGVR